MKKRLLALLLSLLLMLGSLFAGCSAQDAELVFDILDELMSSSVEESSVLTEENSTEESSSVQSEISLDKEKSYTSAEEVALYLHLYGELPKNFITKSQARELGWEGGSLEPYAPGCCIGGDRFGNYEGLLPKDRTYTECDIDTLGADSRGAKRLVFSQDGLIYYTEDHYETFILLYGEE